MIGTIRITQNCYNTENNNKEVEVLTEWAESIAINDDISTQRCRVRFLSGEVRLVQKHQLRRLDNANDKSNWNECVWQPSLNTSIKETTND